MNIRKLLAVLLAAAMCFSLSLTGFAVNGEEESTQENTSAESTTAEESTSEQVSEESSSQEQTSEEASEEAPSEEQTSEEASEEAPSEEQTSEEASEEVPSEENSEEAPSEESSEAPDEDDVIALIINLLGKIELDEVKDALNDINEALGLPRLESFTDIPAYADVLYEKLEEMGLGYADIINGLASSDILDWLNDLIFGGGSSKPVTTAPADNDSNEGEEDSIIPDTGVTLGAAGAAVAVLGGSGALALFLRKRNNDED